MELAQYPTQSGFFLRPNSCFLPLNPKDKCNIVVAFSPESPGTFTSQLTIVSSIAAGTKYSDIIQLQASSDALLVKPGLTWSAPEIQFGIQNIDSAATEQSIDITNTTTGDIALHLTPGENKEFRLTSNQCPDSLQGGALKANAHCSIKVNYFPTDPGAKTGAIKIEWTVRNAAGRDHIYTGSISLYGTGRETGSKLSIKAFPRSLLFARTEVSATSAEQTVEITNSGSATVTNLQITLKLKDRRFLDDQRTPPEFEITSGPAPRELAPSEHYDLKLVFKPALAGPVNGALDISWVATNASGLEVKNREELRDSIELIGAGVVSNVIGITNTSDFPGTPAARVVAGIDVSGASSADAAQKFFVEATLDAPFHFRGKDPRAPDQTDPLDARIWFFLTPRIASLPQSSATLTSVTSAGDFFTPALTLTSTDIVQSLDVLGGFEVAFKKPRQGIPFWSGFHNARARMGLSGFLGLGFTTPFSAAKSAAEFDISKLSATQKAQLGVNDNTKTIAAYVLERSRFMRKYYAGLRLKVYHFTDRAKATCNPPSTNSCEALLNLFPGTIDVGFGQDESVTGGQLRHWVFRLDTVYPLPFAQYLTVFGSIFSSLQKNDTSLPATLSLPPSANAVALGDPTVAVLPARLASRDYYRLGIAVDLTQVFKLAAKPKQ